MSQTDKIYKCDPHTTFLDRSYTPVYYIVDLSSDIGFSSQGCFKQIVKVTRRNVDIVGGIAAGVTAIEVNTTYPSCCYNNKCIERRVLGLYR